MTSDADAVRLHRITKWVFRRIEREPNGILCKRCMESVRRADAVMLAVAEHWNRARADVYPVHPDCVHDSDMDMGVADMGFGEFRVFLQRRLDA